METRDAARRWAAVWAAGWPGKDAESIIQLQSEDGVHWASLFRRYNGRPGLRSYLADCFAEETAPAEAWFAEPVVDGSRASVEYWVVLSLAEGQMTVSGCTVLEFDAAGQVTEARDYSHAREGRMKRPRSVVWAFSSEGSEELS